MVEKRLSDREETSVVRLVAEGRTNKEIGCIAGLVRHAVRNGLIEP